MAQRPHVWKVLVALLAGLTLLPSAAQGQTPTRPSGAALAATSYAIVGTVFDGSAKVILLIPSEAAVDGSVVDTLPLDWNVATIIDGSLKTKTLGVYDLSTFSVSSSGLPVQLLDWDPTPLLSPLFVVHVTDFTLGEKSFVVDLQGVVHSVRKVDGRDDRDIRAFDCRAVKDYPLLYVRPFLGDKFGKKTRFRSCRDLKRQIYQVEASDGKAIAFVAGRRALK